MPVPVAYSKTFTKNKLKKEFLEIGLEIIKAFIDYLEPRFIKKISTFLNLIKNRVTIILSTVSLEATGRIRVL